MYVPEATVYVRNTAPFNAATTRTLLSDWLEASSRQMHCDLNFTWNKYSPCWNSTIRFWDIFVNKKTLLLTIHVLNKFLQGHLGYGSKELYRKPTSLNFNFNIKRNKIYFMEKILKFQV